ncbi:unnamed protein product [Auanema sp. JU1783]|nr:unnamed protein product [Auanema sp. JU1783]
MDLERGVSNIKIDDNLWRPQHDQTSQAWGGPMPGAASGSNPGGWGHMSPQQMRNPWPDGNLAQNVNDALGISGPPAQGWVPMSGAHADFNDKIWSDAHAEPQQFQSMHNHHRGINGMMDAPGDWGAAGPNQSHQQMWSDPQNLKAEQDAYWKQQQQQQPGNTWGMSRGGPMGGFHMGPPNNHPRVHEGQMGVMMGMRVPGPNGWNPPPGVYRPQAPSDRNIWGRGGGPPRMSGRGYHPGGVDMSVPPPIDMPGEMHMQGVNQMRQIPPPNNMMGGMWKQDPMGPNGMRSNSYGQSQQVPSPFAMPSKSQAPPGQFPIAGADDLMWHDPNGDLKKWQRDTGVSLWGDPEKCNERPVRLWVVPEGEEEDIEVALSKCPIPQKRNEDGSARLPLSLPTKRPIVVTGWGELPENDPNNPSKQGNDDLIRFWGDITPVPSNDAPWYLPSQQQSNFAADTSAWGQPPATENSNFAHKHIADQLKYAVEKGYLDMSILSLPTLPPHVLQNITSLLTKIPLLESVQNELKTLTESVRPEGELEGSSPVRWMNEVQKVDYNRLIIDVTTANIEVSDLSKKISTGLADAGMAPMPQDSNRGEAYHYSFLE